VSGRTTACVEGASNGEKRWQVVVPKGLQEAVLKAMHRTAGSGHFGVTKTLRRLRQVCYWGQCRRDVEDFCRRCDPCMARKGPPVRSHAPLQQFPVGVPMERVAVDVVGPLPLSNRGNRYVLTAIDYFTKWTEAYALPDQEAVTVTDALVAGMFSRFGVPESLQSDQGRNFESRVFASMCTQLGMHKTHLPLAASERRTSREIPSHHGPAAGHPHVSALGRASAPCAHGMSLCCPGVLSLFSCPPHVRERASHPCRFGVWSATGFPGHSSRA